MYLDHSSITLEGNCSVIFYNNTAGYSGGALFVDYSSDVEFTEKSTSRFYGNMAYHDGGALYTNDGSITFEGFPAVAFNDNRAGSNGGAVYIYNKDSITLDLKPLLSPTISFNNNEAITNGGAMYIDHSCIRFTSNFSLSFHNNNAINNNGGALYLDHSNITF